MNKFFLFFISFIQVARKRIRHKPGNKVSLIALKSSTKTGQTLTIKNVPLNENNNDNYLSSSSAKKIKPKFNLQKKISKI